MNRPPIRLRIERLVLDGVAPRDRAAVMAAFQAELARVLGSSRTPEASSAAPVVSVAAPSPAKGTSAGRAAAAALGRAIGGTRQ